MHILMVVRDDYRMVFGGDVVMVSNLQRHLEPLGVHLEILTAAELPAVHGADVAHLTFLHLPEAVQQVARWARTRSIPIAISPLLESPLYLWFEWAIYHSTKWRALSRSIGRRLARTIYISWQSARRKTATSWQKQKEILPDLHLVPNSYYELNQLKKWFELSDLKGSVVPLGIAADLWSNPPINLDNSFLPTCSNYVLQVGRIETRKNQVALLHALRNTSIPIVFLGKFSPHDYETPYVNVCRNLATKRGNVYFIDWLPVEAMPAIYKKAAVHVLPSWSELPGLVTLEAAACGCKVVSTSFSPIREYLGDDVWCCRPDNTKSIQRTVEKALSSPVPPGLRSKVLDGLTWQRSASLLASVYKGLV